MHTLSKQEMFILVLKSRLYFCALQSDDFSHWSFTGAEFTLARYSITFRPVGETRFDAGAPRVPRMKTPLGILFNMVTELFAYNT